MNCFLAETLQDVSAGYSSLIKTGIILLIGIGAFIWWLKRQT
jgi:hypothetical protein